MDLATTTGSVLAAFGLAGAAGLNAWLPLLAAALLARTGAVDLAEPFGDLTTTTGIAVLAVLTVLDFVGDKVPVVDSVLHGAGALVAPASGAVLFAGQTGLETELPTLVAVVAGALVAGTVHAERAAVRPVATLGSGGVGNPVLSLVEDAGALVLTAAAFVLPVLAAVAVLVLVAGGLLAVRAVRGRLRRAQVR
jgi:hypothetical protein